MIDREHAVMTQLNNVAGTLNLLFAIARARAGVPPGEARHDGRVRDPEHRHRGRVHHHRAQRQVATRCRTPSCPGSFYHLSKVHDSHNIHFVCRAWGIAATDLNQGVVYGCTTAGDGAPSRARDPIRLRRDLGHGAQSVHRAVGDRQATHRVRQRRPDAWLPRHPRHHGVRAAEHRASGAARRVPRVQPVHRAVLGAATCRAGA